MKVGKVVIVGGSGMVGQEIMQVMKDHCINLSELIIVGSKTVGEKKKTPYGNLVVTELNEWAFGGSEFVFFAAGADVSNEWIPKIRNQGFRIIDLSSAFRQDPQVPLIIPSINADAIGDSDLIACPNCTTSIALMVLAPIHEAFQINRVSLVSYQAASGAGKKALDDLEKQIESWAKNSSPQIEGKTAKTPLPLAGNLIPRIDSLNPIWQGFTREEMKTHWEANKILFRQNGNRTVYINSTCVRVPVRRCHSEVLSIQTERAMNRKDVLFFLRNAFGVTIFDTPENWIIPTPLNMEGKEEVGVGRIRILPDSRGKEVLLWVCGDQLLRGAALTAVEILEYCKGKEF